MINRCERFVLARGSFAVLRFLARGAVEVRSRQIIGERRNHGR
jgi:hypothetical protein